MPDKIQENLKNISDKLKEINEKLSRRNKLAIAGGLAALIVIAVVGAILLNQSSNAVLFSELSQQEAAEVVAKIADMGVEASYNSDGTVTVPAKQADQLRAQLVLQGYPKTGLAYSRFIDNVSMMSTDFEKDMYKLYDLQDRVAATITCFDGIESAVVNFSPGDENKYVFQTDRKEPSAWAVVTMKPGYTLNDDQVRGIQRLLAKSISGLSEENVSVYDENGRDYTLSADTSTGGTARLKRALEEEFENSISAKLVKLLSPVYGADNLRVSVTSTVDVKKTIQERITYIPATDDNKGVMDEESNRLEIVGDGTAAAGTPGTDTNSNIPIYPEVTFDGEEIYYADENAFHYLVSQLTEQIQNDGGDVLDVSVSLVINDPDLPTREIADLRQLAASTAGIPQIDANEKVSVLATSFIDGSSVPASVTLSGLLEKANDMKWLILGGLLLLILLIVLIRVLLKKFKRNPEEDEEAEAAAAAATEEPQEELISLKLEDMKKTREMELKDEIRDFVDNNPEISAQLIRTWLKGGGDDSGY